MTGEGALLTLCSKTSFNVEAAAPACEVLFVGSLVNWGRLWSSGGTIPLLLCGWSGLACRFSFELKSLIASWPCNDLWVSCWAWLSSGALPALCAGDTWDHISRRMEWEQDFVVEENPGCKNAFGVLVSLCQNENPFFCCFADAYVDSIIPAQRARRVIETILDKTAPQTWKLSGWNVILTTSQDSYSSQNNLLFLACTVLLVITCFPKSNSRSTSGFRGAGSLPSVSYLFLLFKSTCRKCLSVAVKN